MVTQNDLVFDMVVSKFYNQAIFRQKVEINNYDNPVSGSFEFMTCDDTQCLAPEIIDFRFNFSNNILENETQENTTVNQNNLEKNNNGSNKVGAVLVKKKSGNDSDDESSDESYSDDKSKDEP